MYENINDWLDEIRPTYKHPKELLIEFDRFADLIIRGYFKDCPYNNKERFKSWVKAGMRQADIGGPTYRNSF